jgi:hypothetical protein
MVPDGTGYSAAIRLLHPAALCESVDIGNAGVFDSPQGVPGPKIGEVLGNAHVCIIPSRFHVYVSALPGECA